MPSYLVTGGSRGLGFEFLRQLSSDSKNTVIGLVRDKEATERKVAVELNRSNIYIVQGDILDYASIQKSVDVVSKITGGSLDFLIANAGYISDYSGYETLSSLATDPAGLDADLQKSFQTNVIGNIHLFNLFIPLILKGEAKKVITISTGFADLAVSNQMGVSIRAPYSISKAAMNIAVSRYSAEYASQGVLFLSVAPGIIDTGHPGPTTPEQGARAMALMGKFVEYAPHFKGPITAEESISLVLSVVHKSSLADGLGGGFVSQFGNQQWL